MYEIFNGNTLLYATYLQAKDKKILNPKWSMELGKAGELTFTAPPEHPMYTGLNTNDSESRYDKLNSTILLRKNGNKVIWTGRVLHDDKDFYGNKEVYCEGRLAYLNDGIAFPYSFGYGKSPEYEGDPRHIYGPVDIWTLVGRFIQMYNLHQISKKRFLHGDVTVTAFDEKTTFKMKSDEYNSIYSELMDKFCNDSNFGGYFYVHYTGTQVSNLQAYLDYLKYINSLSEDPDAPHSGQVIRFGENLLDITEYVDAANIYTVVTPLGKYTTNYKCNLDTGNRVGTIINVLNEGSKVSTLWGYLREHHASNNKVREYGTTDAIPMKDGKVNDGFIHDFFPNSEQGPRLSIASVNIENGRSYDYIPTPSYWTTDAGHQDSLIAKYGTIERTVIYDDVDSPSELLTLGQKYRSLVNFVDTISITAADLSLVDVNVDDIELGDLVDIESVPHGITAQFQLRKIEYDFENPMSTVYTFGSSITGLTDRQLDNAKQTLKNTERANSTENLINKIDAIDSDGQLNYAKKSELLALQTETNNAILAIRQLPPVTADDNGKILKVINGTWQLVKESDETDPLSNV